MVHLRDRVAHHHNPLDARQAHKESCIGLNDLLRRLERVQEVFVDDPLALHDARVGSLGSKCEG